MKWSNNKDQIMAIEYSKALKSVIVLGQGLGNATEVKTALYKVDPQSEDWPVLLDLKTAVSSLHSTTMSPDGRYLVAALPHGSGDFPPVHLVTVDVVAKKVVNKVVALGTDFSILAAIPCPGGEVAERMLVV
eukprot:gnl/TRDRNA2_/TRDRNA2_128504_c0_seq1.p1 gnl/TRDRNA2_/TRDRNA2_128504_c0~~gnl/TRDRNA2_/TRDRNA2_128504_c0_seq1.p1  ORF type:complete len:132 (-),score=23.49 gnl/TRDRNA2_/TRDRNA2_128504_c0_seq1:204-599(-)